MDFSFSEEQMALQATARRFAEAELSEIARAVEQNDQPPGPDVVRRFAEMGFLGVNLDSDYGGQGAGHLEAVLVLEEIAKVSPAIALRSPSCCMVTSPSATAARRISRASARRSTRRRSSSLMTRTSKIEVRPR